MPPTNDPDHEASLTREDWFQHLLRIRSDRLAAGYPFMSSAEATAYAQQLRDLDWSPTDLCKDQPASPPPALDQPKDSQEI